MSATSAFGTTAPELAGLPADVQAVLGLVAYDARWGRATPVYCVAKLLQALNKDGLLEKPGRLANLRFGVALEGRLAKQDTPACDMRCFWSPQAVTGQYNQSDTEMSAYFYEQNPDGGSLTEAPAIHFFCWVSFKGERFLQQGGDVLTDESLVEMAGIAKDHLLNLETMVAADSARDSKFPPMLPPRPVEDPLGDEDGALKARMMPDGMRPGRPHY